MTDGKTALAELTEISAQIEAAVLFGVDGQVIAATVPDDRAKQMAASAKTLFEEAGRSGEGELTHLEAVTADGSLFLAREGELMIAASTSAEPTAGLVFYDLKACLRKAAEKPAPKSRPRAKPKAKPKRTTKGKGSGTS